MSPQTINQRSATGFQNWSGSMDPRFLSSVVIEDDSQVQSKFIPSAFVFGKGRRDMMGMKVYSRKVFIGGLPPDITEEEIRDSFRMFGTFAVEWPRKGETPYMFPPKGFAFLLFASEKSVHELVQGCGCWSAPAGNLYYPVSSLSTKQKLVEVRPWKISNSFATIDPYFVMKGQYIAFIGGVPRRITSLELARTLASHFEGVSYVGITLEKFMAYPNGCGFVMFSSFRSYSEVISRRFVTLRFSHKFMKLVEFKPYEKLVSHQRSNCDKGLELGITEAMKNFELSGVGPSKLEQK